MSVIARSCLALGLLIVIGTFVTAQGQDDTLPERTTFTFPGEGDGDVRRIVKDLLAGGYDGGISIEPHLAVVFHDASVTSDADVRFQNYVEYGRRMGRLVAELTAT